MSFSKNVNFQNYNLEEEGILIFIEIDIEKVKQFYVGQVYQFCRIKFFNLENVRKIILQYFLLNRKVSKLSLGNIKFD